MLGIIGGTGLYRLDGLNILDQVDVDTPFGVPSAPLVRASYQGRDVIFLPRHGAHHDFLPHEINYRANVYALKKMGVRQVISVSAVGSLRAELEPGHFVLPFQYIDWVRGGREKSFFEKGMPAHVSMARPVCPELYDYIVKIVRDQNMPLHINKTYVCVDGPRFGTAAESHMFRALGADIIGMTNVPEVFLMREAQISYVSLCIVTDYDAWQDDPALHADTSAILARYGKSLGQAMSILQAILSGERPPQSDFVCTALAGTLMRDPDILGTGQRSIWDVLSA